MSQQQQQQHPRMPQAQEQPIKYGHGDVFDVQGDIARQSVENLMVGQIPRGGAALVIQSAATRNDISKVAGDGGVVITETDLPGRRVITESVGGQVIGQNIQRAPLAPESTFERGAGTITIGEALEATALTAGQKPVDYSDAAAIQAAEVRATGRTNIVPGGVAAAAQSAATRNARATRDEEKTKLVEVLSEAAAKLPADKPVTRRDAEGVIGAELRNDPNLTTRPGGVAASVAAAARLNENNQYKY